MKKFWSMTGFVLWLLLVAGAMTGIVMYKQWYDLPKFQDVTMELGEELPDLAAFYTPDADPAQVVLLTENVDASAVGTYELTFRHSAKRETVQLVVQDTTAPEVVFQDVSVQTDAVLKPEDFVVEASDLSALTISFAQPLETPESYGDVSVEIVVEDAYGNRTTGLCKVNYVWMTSTFTMELGNTLTAADLLFAPERDAHLLDQSQLDAVNSGGVGQYTITSTDGDLTCACEVTVVDTTPPVLELQSVAVFKGGRATLSDFIVSATDLSGEVTTKLLTTLDFNKMGTQTVTIEATDANGNVTTAQTTLRIVTDTNPPSFSGVDNMTVEKHSSPDYRKGVSAYDSRDGAVSFTVDSSRVNTAKAGTYYAIYTAVDSSGNKTTYRRKVTVNHDAEDTTELVKSIAATLPRDAEQIRDYVRNTIAYNTNWGGNDPVWFGFKNKVGNCYVHALCLQRLLTEKGYTTQLIWVNQIKNGRPSHYWLIINLGGVWRHIDATPSRMHGKYSLMTDAQRYETLVSNGVQRDWDRDKWPACN